jgi:hypothetical protein
MLRAGSVICFALFALARIAAGGSLIGDSVTAELTSLDGHPITQQFTSPAIVGPGVEFTGVWSGGGPGSFVTVDLDASSFTIEMPVGLSEGSFSGVFEVSLGDLDFDGGLHALNFVFPPDYFGGSVTHTANSVTVVFGTVISGVPYEFRLAPEPGCAALGLVAVALVGAARARSRGAAAP